MIKSLENTHISKGSRVILRLDLNVPVKDGVVTDGTRIKYGLKTLTFLKEAGAHVAILGQRGRKKIKLEETGKYSLEAVIKYLSGQLGIDIEFVKDKEDLFKSAWTALENTRSFDGTPGYFDQLEGAADFYVFEDFPVAYRSLPSTTEFLKHFKGEVCFGYNFIREVDHITSFLDKDKIKHPVSLILGGVNIEEKAPVVRHFLDIADTFVFGGALANTFLKSEGYEIGESAHDEEDFELAQDLMIEIGARGKKLVLPTDVIVADRIIEGAKKVDMPVDDMDFVEVIGDIGKVTVMKIAKIIRDSKTIIFNGPMGAYEVSGFEKGTKAIFQFLETEAKKGDEVLLGGGDTLNSLHKFGISHSSFNFVSTGGASMLYLLSGRELPIITATKN